MKDLQWPRSSLGAGSFIGYISTMNLLRVLTSLVCLCLASFTAQAEASSRQEGRSRCYLTAILKDGAFAETPVENADFVLVDKGNKRLYLWRKNKVLKSYPIALGFQPLGHKQQEGDGKTPEGIYSINLKNPKSQFFLSLGVSYPNANDRKSAAQRGVSAGGDIMIHGLPNDPLKLQVVSLIHPFYNWTEGCIAVTNEQIQEIYRAVQTGSKIEICP